MYNLASIYWDVSPEIFSIGFVHIRWYGLLFALGFVVGYQIISRIYRMDGKPQKDVESLIIVMIIAVVIGARLGHCLYYSPEYYLSNPIEILKIWEGGLASHGAATAIPIALWFYARKRPNMSLLWVFDRVVIVIPVAAAFVRLGNFFNSEIIGTPSDLPWAVVFAKVDEIARHPAQLYEAIAYIGIFIYLFFKYKKSRLDLNEGYLFGVFLTLLFGARFLIEFVKRHQIAFESSLPIDMGQILSIPFILVGIYFIITKRKKSV